MSNTDPESTVPRAASGDGGARLGRVGADAGEGRADPYNALITRVEPDPEPRPGPLSGRRLLVKDLIDTAGIRTTYGSQIYCDHVPERTAPAVQKLLAHSDQERSYTYDFQKHPFDVDNYVATIRVAPVTDGNRSFVEWWTTFDCDRDRIAHWEGFFASEVFQGGLDALKAHFAGS